MIASTTDTSNSQFHPGPILIVVLTTNHDYYDFYSFDIGKPTGPRVKVSNGVSYKIHQRGFIAYNITSSAKEIAIEGSSKTVSVQPKTGLFCKSTGSGFDCLSAD
jgi:hypothetical protein